MSQPAFDLAYLPLGAAAFGGAERSLLDLADGMVESGKRVIVFAEGALRETPFPQIAAERGIELVWVGWAPEHGLMTNVREALRVFRRYPARIIHFNISWRERMWVVPVVAKLCTGAKLLGSMRAMPDPHQLVPRKRYFRLVPGLRLWHLPEVLVGHVWAKVLDFTVSINANDFPKRLVASYGFASDRIRVIYNGIAAPAQLATTTQRRSMRQSLGLSDGDILIAYSGRLSREKGVHILVRALSQLPGRFHLVLVGDGPQRGELALLTQELGVSGRTHFAGFLREPDSIIGVADIVAVPSLWYEAFGRVVVEAMSLGVPVVASRIGGMAELFEDGVHGHYVPPGDAERLATTLAQFGADKNARERSGAEARKLVLSRYSLERVRAQYAELYSAIGQ